MAAEYQLDLDKYYSVDKTPEQDIGQQGDIQEVQYLYTVLGTDCFGLLDSLARYQQVCIDFGWSKTGPLVTVAKTLLTMMKLTMGDTLNVAETKIKPHSDMFVVSLQLS